MRINRKSSDAVLALLFTFVSVATANDWPQWRGPNRDALCAETGLLQDWPPQGPPLVWKASGLGIGLATVAVADGKIYTVGEQGDSSFVIALKPDDGKTLWSSKLGKSGAPGWGGFAGPRGAPTVAGGLLFALGQWGELACFDCASGKELWRRDCIKDFGGTRPEWGYAESPLVDGDQVVLTPGGPQGAIVALNKKTGATLWSTKDFTDLAHYSSLVPAEIQGVRQYIQLTAATVVGIAAADGKVLWRAKRKGDTAVIPTPIYHDNQVYVTSAYGIGCNLFKISAANGAFSAEQVYASKAMQNMHGGVVLVGNFLYGHSESKGWTCQELETGKAVWQDKEKLGKGSVLYADKRLYLRLEDGKGTLALIEATPDGYKEHGRFDQPERSQKNSWPHPVIANGKLYLRDQDILLCYDVKAKTTASVAR